MESVLCTNCHQPGLNMGQEEPINHSVGATEPLKYSKAEQTPAEWTPVTVAGGLLTAKCAKLSLCSQTLWQTKTLGEKQQSEKSKSVFFLYT